nr:exopolygalacturonase-like [Ipomoea batatas]
MASNVSFGVVFLLGFHLFCHSSFVGAMPFRLFNVLSYGARPDGRTDNKEAFLNAWKDACKWEGGAKMHIPRGVYMVSSVLFTGTCKGSVTVRIQGIVRAPTNPSLFFGDTWIGFRYIDGLVMEGGGTLDGQGASAWPYNDCNKNPHCPKLPASVRFDFVKNAIVHNIHSINSKNIHFNVFACDNVAFTGVTLLAPRDSPNTDGIHIGTSTNIRISRSVIGTGDDCISMVSGSQNIAIENVVCGPGHGISIGSLGRSQNEFVSNIHIKNCSLLDTQNGVRIKTWAPSYPSKVSNIIFEDIVMTNTNNPIFIDQQYCPDSSCTSQSSSAEIKNVTFAKIRGVSGSKSAVTLNCSPTSPCQDVKLVDINLVYKDGPATSFCSNVRGGAFGKQQPPGCL